MPSAQRQTTRQRIAVSEKRRSRGMQPRVQRPMEFMGSELRCQSGGAEFVGMGFCRSALECINREFFSCI